LLRQSILFCTAADFVAHARALGVDSLGPIGKSDRVLRHKIEFRYRN